MGRLQTLPARIGRIPERVKVATIAETVRIRSGWQWEQIRRRILSRDAGLCVLCQQRGHVTPAREVDHVLPLHRGGTDADDNLQALCAPCHADKTRGEAGGKGCA